MPLKYINFIASLDQKGIQDLIKRSLGSLAFEFDNVHENIFQVKCSSEILGEEIESISDEVLESEEVGFLAKVVVYILKVDEGVDSIYYKIPGIGGLFEKMDRFAERISENVEGKIDDYFEDKIDESIYADEGNIDITLTSLKDKTIVVFSSKDVVSKSVFYCYFLLIKKKILELQEVELSGFSYSEKLEEMGKGEIEVIDKEEKIEDLSFEFPSQMVKVNKLELEVKRLISINKIDEAILFLEDFFETNGIDMGDDVVLLRFKFERIRGMEIKMLATQEEISVNFNKLIISIFKFIDDVASNRDLVKMIK